MHISKLSLRNYRNFKNATLKFNKGINTLIGENGSGKTNIFRAIRLMLDNSLPRAATRLNEEDFCRRLSGWQGHWIIISLEFNDIGQDEVSQALFIHGAGVADEQAVEKATYNLIFRPKAHIRQQLSEINPGDVAALQSIQKSISIADYETVFTGKSGANFCDDQKYIEIVGDFEQAIFPSRISNSEVGSPLPSILSMPNEVSFTFVKALRDVVSDFRNNRTNPLLNLLKLKSEEINSDEFDPIVNAVEKLNQSIESLTDVKDIKQGITDTLNDTLGDTYSPNSLSIQSGLSTEAEQLFQSLKLFVDESSDDHEGAIHEMSLGGANLIFLTLKLLEFKYQKPEESIANFLLVEEPEAHIHTHIQKTLFDKIGYTDTQIIYSTHSSHVSEVSNIRNSNILSKTESGCVAFQPSTGLDPKKVTFIERYLDAIRSNLLFAKSVILVEGDAEEILIPTLVKQSLGLSLDELGITLVNMRSTGFENIALLFHDNRIRKSCGIITDLDQTFFDTTPNTEDSDSVAKAKSKAAGSAEKGMQRKAILDEFCDGNNWINAFYAEHTFEVDFLKSLNANYLIDTVNDVYTCQNTIETTIAELKKSDIAIAGKRALTMANNQGKGWFAITLGSKIDFNVNVPSYIANAISFAHGTFTDKQVLKIIEYRFNSIQQFVSEQRARIDAIAVRGQHYTDWDNYLTPLETGINSFLEKWLEFNENGGSVSELKQEFINSITMNSNSFLQAI
ncbi:MAG: AAA family ATPase [Gammaproteobacteria bacterium]|nr:AAA family ATPase [Gammaproteobacteria bacterium]